MDHILDYLGTFIIIYARSDYTLEEIIYLYIFKYIKKDAPIMTITF